MRQGAKVTLQNGTEGDEVGTWLIYRSRLAPWSYSSPEWRPGKYKQLHCSWSNLVCLVSCVFSTFLPWAQKTNFHSCVHCSLSAVCPAMWMMTIEHGVFTVSPTCIHSRPSLGPLFFHLNNVMPTSETCWNYGIYLSLDGCGTIFLSVFSRAAGQIREFYLVLSQEDQANMETQRAEKSSVERNLGQVDTVSHHDTCPAMRRPSGGYR